MNAAKECWRAALAGWVACSQSHRLLQAGDATSAPFGLDGGRVAGFAFTVTGPDLPFLRLQALPGGADPTAVNFHRGFSARPLLR
jgi:hypothetical protein